MRGQWWYVSVMVALVMSTFIVEGLDKKCGEERKLTRYEELCCIEENLGKTFIDTKKDEDTVRYTLCPDIKPEVGCPSSCSDIFNHKPNAESGFYTITLDYGGELEVYCDMDGINCLEKGWTRVAYINMNEPDTKCPPGFVKRQYNNNNITKELCANTFSSKKGEVTCDSTVFNTFGLTYSKVCGRVYGYQHGNGLAFLPGEFPNPPPKLTDGYITGVSITKHEKHIWTFASAKGEILENFEDGYCPCSFAEAPQQYIGESYTCESGRTHFLEKDKTIYLKDKLWDRSQCRDEEQECCDDNQLPGFIRTLDDTNQGDIELRLCGKKPVCNDDDCTYCETPLELIELYIK